MARTPRIAATKRLAQFLGSYRDRALPEQVMHQTGRLVLNGLAASIAAFDHPATRILQRWAQANASGQSGARLLWLGDSTTIDNAAVVNGAMMEMLDFNETHIEAYVHPTAPVWPAVQAVAEMSNRTLAETMHAGALGIEVELAMATALMPGHYTQGFNPAVAAGAVGAAAGCAVLLELNERQTAHALGLAALGNSGPLEALGTMAHPYAIGSAARNGLIAARLAAEGFEAPNAAIEGKHGMLATVADQDDEKLDKVLVDLGERWMITGPIAFKRYPTETITQPLIECTAAVLDRTTAVRQAQVETMRFTVEPVVARVAEERRTRFGAPADDLQARFDPAYCIAAAWVTAGFGPDRLAEPTRSNPAVLGLRERVSFVSDEYRSMVGGELEVTFADGTTETASVDAYRGSADNPLSDAELVAKFATAAGDALPRAKVDEIADAVWSGQATMNSILDVARLD